MTDKLTAKDKKTLFQRGIKTMDAEFIMDLVKERREKRMNKKADKVFNDLKKGDTVRIKYITPNYFRRDDEFVVKNKQSVESARFAGFDSMENITLKNKDLEYKLTRTIPGMKEGYMRDVYLSSSYGEGGLLNEMLDIKKVKKRK